MLAKRSKVTLEDYIRRKNKNKVSQYPTNNFSIIPSWNKEFVCLVGLENVVQFRLEWLDKTAYSSSNQHKTSDLNSSSSSSMTSPSSGFPLVNPNQCISQKVTKSYRMETPLAKALIKDDKVEQEMKKEIEEWKMMNKSQSKEEKNGKMAALNAPSRQQILPKTQLLTPNVQRKSAKKYKMTIKELNTVHGNLQKVTPNVSSATSGSSTNTSGSGKSKPTIHYLPKTWSAVSGNARNQGSRSSAKKGPVTMDEKFSVEVQHQANLTHPSTAQISSASTHMFSSSQTALSTNQGKTNPWDNKWEATSNQKIDDKWIQKPKNSVKCTGSYASSSSSLFGQPTK
ncbi:hypothetical protein KOW79_005967 [Hemibagrus wyckioides]|uniref:Uncharacterized protein n=1 Tax=Hemibagrus wyckioides TaxID=337641 RepID=A0A9D3NYV9_9TELE|nr:hypothetical protein KOW79_005967 [Hemibagrus wyckioides]